MRKVVLELSPEDRPLTVAELKGTDFIGVEFRDGYRGAPITIAHTKWVLFCPETFGKPKKFGCSLITCETLRELLLEIEEPREMFKFNSRLELINWLVKLETK